MTFIAFPGHAGRCWSLHVAFGATQAGWRLVARTKTTGSA